MLKLKLDADYIFQYAAYVIFFGNEPNTQIKILTIT